PRRRVHSPSGIAAIAVFGLPPPRIVIGYPLCSRVPNPVCPFSLESVAHAAGRNATPSGTLPGVTSRHSPIRYLRASATIIVVLRAPLVWGFPCQGCHAIFVFLCHSILLFDPRRRAFFRPDRHISIAVAARRLSRTALLQRRRRLVLDGR